MSSVPTLSVPSAQHPVDAVLLACSVARPTRSRGMPCTRRTAVTVTVTAKYSTQSLTICQMFPLHSQPMFTSADSDCRGHAAGQRFAYPLGQKLSKPTID